jgi:apolipoprotein N-acyltransferase
VGEKSWMRSSRNRWPLLWLAVAGVLAFFGNGRWLIPAATWLAPIFFLRFTHSQKPILGLAVGGYVMAAIYVASWQDMTTLSGCLYILTFIAIGLAFWTPYCVDRLLAPRIGGFPSTFVFPLAYVSVELFCILASPFSSWGSLAYTQADFLPLAQLASVTGTLGITFLIAWTAAVVNWVWQQGFDWAAVRRGASVCTAVFIAVLVFGWARLTVGQSQSEEVRVATVAATGWALDQKEAADADPDAAVLHYQAILAGYLARTRDQARAGAQIVVWDETAVTTTSEQEPAVIAQGQALAGEEAIYLLLPLRVEDPASLDGSQAQAPRNEAVLIGPDGRVLFTYLKSRLTPGDPSVPGDGVIDTAQTPVGKLAAAICFDMDHPDLMAQAGRHGVELMLVPAADKGAMPMMHLNMARLRAIENGFAVVRSTRRGFSATIDSHGGVLAMTDSGTSDGTMLAGVPVQTTWTLYPRIGDLVGWLCLAGLGFMTAWGIAKGRPRDAARIA